MQRTDTAPREGSIPAIDAAIVSHTEVATFAVG